MLQTAPETYIWQNTDFDRPDKEQLVIYELLVRDFVANHDYDTLMDTLGYFKKLGINAIELMPVNEFERNESWGYDFNHAGAVTQELVDRINRFWLGEYNIDGFRFDFIKGFTNRSGSG